MALAIHHGGPADGAEVPHVEQTQTRWWAGHAERATRGWVLLNRYVFVPPRDGATCRYQWTGTEQRQGPVPGSAEQPEWST